MNLNKNTYLKWGITFLLFLFGAFCMMKAKGYCDEEPKQDCYLLPQHREKGVPTEDEYLYQYPFTYEQTFIPYAKRTNWGKAKPSAVDKRKEWQEAYEFHMFEAKRTYTDAYNRVWWLPDLTWRQLGRDAWVAACGTAGGASVCGRLVIAFSTMLSAYGLHCLDEWDYIHDKLYWSEYHFRECEKYQRMLQK